MKPLVILLALFIPSLSFAWLPEQDKPFLSKEFNASGIEQIGLETAGISINISSWTEDRVLVEVFAMRDNQAVSSNDAQLLKKLEAYDFQIEQVGEKIELKVDQSKKSGIKMSRDNIVLLIKIQTPQDISSKIQSTGGAVTLAGLQGKQQIISKGGSLRVIQGTGTIQSETQGGSILVDSYKGELNLSSAGGSVRVEKFSGILDINSAGGSLNLFDLSGKISAEAAGGSIRASFQEKLESVNLSSKGGSIDALLPKGMGMNVLFKGSIVVNNHPNFEGEIKRSQVSGSINGGGIPIVFETSGANVRVDYR
ncbi:hypothetical protein [Cecembia rubra]|uniref:hypothetical protein n=1 Tax=Cecembia rubra TaxID=1485585 RepID=UPI002714CBE8|nr:hypothetical protein [Cecembia rubra]